MSQIHNNLWAPPRLSMRMVTNMTLKHLTPAVMSQLAGGLPAAPAAASAAVAPATTTAAPMVAVAASAPVSVAAPAPVATSPAPAAPAEAAEAAKPVRMYRGRPY